MLIRRHLLLKNKIRQEFRIKGKDDKETTPWVI